MRNVLSILLVFCVAIAVQSESIKSKNQEPTELKAYHIYHLLIGSKDGVKT